jgi:putative transposase
MGKVKNDWQDVEWVLKLSDERLWVARRHYRAFVRKGVSQCRRKAKIIQKSDERILYDGDFVEQVLSATREQMERKYRLEAQGYDLDKIVEWISYLMNLEPSEIRAAGKER